MSISPLTPASDDAVGLRWLRRCVDGVDVVSLFGELDLTTGTRLRDVLVGVASSTTAGTIVVDLSRVDFIDGGSVGVIVQAATIAREEGRAFLVAGLHGLPEKVFRLVGPDYLAAGHGVSEDEGETDVR